MSKVQISEDDTIPEEVQERMAEVSDEIEAKLKLIEEFINTLEMESDVTLSIGMTLVMRGIREQKISKDFIHAIIDQTFEKMIGSDFDETLN